MLAILHIAPDGRAAGRVIFLAQVVRWDEKHYT